MAHGRLQRFRRGNRPATTLGWELLTAHHRRQGGTSLLLATFKEEVEIVTDAPVYDWPLFCELAYDEGRWPRHVRNQPTDATTLKPINDGQELPHHALLDARIIAGMFS